ncbi:hypothetical protein HNR19_001448 [Nocardioides thalensis]|uniref:Sulfotransferase family protein n=1 Tax=Nocardioides thalensis TaxID=1914755 RepID=A0A853BXU5_9ACTN|nr:hypothetical protein [Nocardioides thalensis]NYJ00750.1 hypothetical protein [Nocardioides thalensis]
MSAGGTLVDLVLHVGMNKAGSTSIQHFLRGNETALAAGGWLYPRTPGKVRHVRVGFYVKSDAELARTGAWVTGDYPDPDVFRARFPRRLAAELHESGQPRAILSEEYLWHAGRLPAVRELVAPFARSTRVVVYLRRQDDHLISAYQQSVRGGDTQRIDSFAAARARSAHYDYGSRLTAWQRDVAPDALVVRRFGPAHFAGGSLYQDFLDAAEIDVPATSLEIPPRRNESLDAEAVEFLRVYNLHRIENEGVRPAQIRNGRLSQRLAESADRGPTLTLAPQHLDAIMARFADSNRHVARHWLGETGELFPPSRETAGTTTVQRLDPERLDHYLAELEIPESQHAALRRIAEREASLGTLNR